MTKIQNAETEFVFSKEPGADDNMEIS